MHGGQRPADVHHAQQPPVPRVVQRRPRARPLVVAGDEVLRREHLDRPPGHQGGAHPVRADHRLVPVRAHPEAEPVRRAQDRGRALPPQQPPVRVGDDHDVQRGVQRRQQPLAQHRQDLPQRRFLAPFLRLGGRQHPRAGVPVRVHPAGQHPPPGLGDLRARLRRQPLPGQCGRAHPLEQARGLPRVHGLQARHVDHAACGVGHRTLPVRNRRNSGTERNRAEQSGTERNRAEQDVRGNRPGGRPRLRGLQRYATLAKSRSPDRDCPDAAERRDSSSSGLSRVGGGAESARRHL